MASTKRPTNGFGRIKVQGPEKSLGRKGVSYGYRREGLRASLTHNQVHVQDGGKVSRRVSLFAHPLLLWKTVLAHGRQQWLYGRVQTTWSNDKESMVDGNLLGIFIFLNNNDNVLEIGPGVGGG